MYVRESPNETWATINKHTPTSAGDVPPDMLMPHHAYSLLAKDHQCGSPSTCQHNNHKQDGEDVKTEVAGSRVPYARPLSRKESTFL